MTAATATPDILDGGAGFPGGAPAADLRAVFGDLMRLHAEAAGIRAEARHRVPHDLDGGSGLIGVKDRVEALGGRVWLTSAQGAGTTVRAELPLGPAT